MKTKIAMASFIMLALSGCATQDYKLYAETQGKIAQAQAMSDTARYAALAEIAKQGDSAAKVAAVMSLNMTGNNNANIRASQMNPPKTIGDTALQWTSILLPSLTQFYSISANRQVSIAQSNNQAAIAQSTNNTFATMSNNQATSNVAIANSGLTAATSIAASGLNATADVAKAGITGVVTTAANGLNAVTAVNASSNTAITNVSNAANTSIQTLANQLKEIQPNVTTTTTTTTTNNTTNNNLTCPTGQTLVNGSCV